MMEITLQLLKEINIGQIFIISCIGWFFYSRLKNDMDRRFEKIDNRFEKMDGRFDKMETRVGRLEMEMVEIKTILRLKECCMIHDERQIKKAE